MPIPKRKSCDEIREIPCDGEFYVGVFKSCQWCGAEQISASERDAILLQRAWERARAGTEPGDTIPLPFGGYVWHTP